MRQVKYRVWNKQRGSKAKMLEPEWSLGINNGELDVTVCYQGHDGRPRFSENFELMQFTGLCDIEGTEIWESDIVRNKNGYPCIIVWDDGRYFFQDRYRSAKRRLSEGTIKHYELVVVGNIYEDKELFAAEFSMVKMGFTPSLKVG